MQIVVKFYNTKLAAFDDIDGNDLEFDIEGHFLDMDLGTDDNHDHDHDDKNEKKMSITIVK